MSWGLCSTSAQAAKLATLLDQGKCHAKASRQYAKCWAKGTRSFRAALRKIACEKRCSTCGGGRKVQEHQQEAGGCTRRWHGAPASCKDR